MPYAIVRISDEKIVRKFGAIPESFDLGERRVVSPVAAGDEGLGHRFVELIEVGFDRPGVYYTKGADVQGPLGPMSITVTRQWTAWSQVEIDAYEAAQHASRVARFDEVGGDTRALAMLVLGEFNRHAAAIMALKNAIANANNLNEVKTAAAAIADVPQKTVAQLRAVFDAALKQ